MILFDADDPLVLNGTYDQEGYKPGERERDAKRKARQEGALMAKRTNNTRRQTGPKSKPGKPTPRPRQAPLIRDARIRTLDECAESIAEVRDQMNELRAQEGDYLKNALKLMRKHQKTTWRYAGVELVRVPGEEKLRVRTSKEKATGEVEEEDQDHAPEEEIVDGTEPPEPNQYGSPDDTDAGPGVTEH